jgi:hypothetical protein
MALKTSMRYKHLSDSKNYAFGASKKWFALISLVLGSGIGRPRLGALAQGLRGISMGTFLTMRMVFL